MSRAPIPSSSVAAPESASMMAVFVDHENVAIGARDASLDPFDIGHVLARLHERGTVVYRRAYSDWARMSGARRHLHEAGFELVEVPNHRLGGKNSADIRMVVDALDLSHNKAHIDTFAVVSGDSDFSPLVAKLRENGKTVLGVGVKASTSSLLVESCDEFFFYDDLVPRRGRTVVPDATPGEGVALLAETAARLLSDRDRPVWASHVKQVLKRKRPQWSERSYGFGGLNDMVEAARSEGLLTLRKDEESGGYLVLSAQTDRLAAS